MDVFDNISAALSALGFQIRNLARYHTRRPGIGSKLPDQSGRDIRPVDLSCQNLKRKCQEGVARQDSCRLIEGLVTGWNPATKVIVIHRRQIVMHERVGMHHFHRRRRDLGIPIHIARDKLAAPQR